MYRILPLAVILFCVQIANAQMNDFYYSEEYLNNLETCTPMTYKTEPIEVWGMTLSAIKQIVGMKDGLCQYEEETGPQDGKVYFSCRFTKDQLKKLVAAMRGPRESKISVSFNIDGLQKAEGDQPSVLWTQYLNDNKICTVK